MTEQDRHAIKLLLESRGWEIVTGLAKERIEKAKLLLLSEQDESRFIEAYRKCHAASNALIEFVADLTELAELEQGA